MDEAARQAEQARIMEEAANWLEKIERTIDKQEAQSLRAWLKLKSHREAIVERCKRWHGPEILAVLGELVPLESLGDRVERQYGRIVLAIVLAVTGIATMTVLTAVSRTLPIRDAKGNPLNAREFASTAVGEQKTIKLPDGGSVVLNTSTGVYLIFAPDSRHVTLLEGEAAFDAKYDPARPFSVFVAGRRFEVLDGDARFNLRKTTQEQAELTVVEGKVRANNARLGSLSPALIRARVKSGEHTFAASEGGTVGPGWQSPWALPPEEIRRRVAWQSGQIILHEEYLEDALHEIERYTPLRFELARPELRATRMSGTFKIGDVEAVQHHLRDKMNVGSRQGAAGTIVLIPLARPTPADPETEHIDCVTNYSCRRLDDTVDVRL